MIATSLLVSLGDESLYMPIPKPARCCTYRCVLSHRQQLGATPTSVRPPCYFPFRHIATSSKRTTVTHRSRSRSCPRHSRDIHHPSPPSAYETVVVHTHAPRPFRLRPPPGRGGAWWGGAAESPGPPEGDPRKISPRRSPPMVRTCAPAP
eukprot:1195526-Prorocentrum_minimum.AAC.3